MPAQNDALKAITEMAMSLLEEMLPPEQVKSVREIIGAYNTVAANGGPSDDYGFSPEGTSMAMEGMIESIVENGARLGFRGREQIKLIALTSMCVGIEIQKARTLALDAAARDQERMS